MILDFLSLVKGELLPEGHLLYCTCHLIGVQWIFPECSSITFLKSQHSLIIGFMEALHHSWPKCMCVCDYVWFMVIQAPALYLSLHHSSLITVGSGVFMLTVRSDSAIHSNSLGLEIQPTHSTHNSTEHLQGLAVPSSARFESVWQRLQMPLLLLLQSSQSLQVFQKHVL